jgi:hypothetical protein
VERALLSLVIERDIELEQEGNSKDIKGLEEE